MVAGSAAAEAARGCNGGVTPWRAAAANKHVDVLEALAAAGVQPVRESVELSRNTAGGVGVPDWACRGATAAGQTPSQGGRRAYILRS